MPRKLKPSAKRRMREQLVEIEREISRQGARAKKHAGSSIGRDAERKAAEALARAQILRMCA